MSLKDIKDAIGKKTAVFGLRETLKNLKGKKKGRTFVVVDARQETLARLKEKQVDFEMLKKKADVAKELNLGFESEVFLIK